MALHDLFSEDTHSFFRSPVREIFKNADMSRIISFAGGYPSPETFPLEDIRTAMNGVIDRVGPKALQYGATQGVLELREVLASRYGVHVDNLQITSSSQQGIDVCARIYIDPGDVVLVSDPSYLGALQSFHSYRADIVGVPYSEDFGTFSASYRRAVAEVTESGRKIKFLYIIPDFQNPSGETLDAEKRHFLVRLARENGFMIVEDSPYRELRYEGEPVPSIYSMDPEIVIHLGSFSKIFAPGFRLGWIMAGEEVLDKVSVCKQSLDLCPPVFDQYVAAEFLRSGKLDSNLVGSISLYRRKRNLMLSLLEKHMPEGVTWSRPQGGLFIFLRLPECVDTVRMYDTALSAGVAYVAGSFFYADGGCRNTMRLNFSFMPEDRIEEGIILLASILRKIIRESGKCI